LILLEVTDNRWREHLYDMDYLREGIHLRGFAQIDPLVAYKNEGFSMFEELMHSVWEEFSKLIFHAEIEVDPSQLERPFGSNGGVEPTALDYSGGTLEGQPSALREVETTGGLVGAAESNGGNTGAAPEVVETVVKDEREKEIGRNDPCWCGSGKKYKKCHGA
jgi:preprotein translocase subunit SecA